MIDKPTIDQLRNQARELGLDPDDDYLEAAQRIIAPMLRAYGALDDMADEIPEVTYPRAAGTRPTDAENPFGAWYMKTAIRGAPDGPLKGRHVAVKDNICVAGVAMANGSSTLDGFVPELDATVVTRILDAGGEIAGKAVCEYFCVGASSATSATGPVHNPLRHGYSAGGSSSGSAALVAAGEVPMSLGCDQGGSVRIPASFCGVHGMKPSFGLVPYSGILSLEPTIDHCGPITACVEDNALLLEILAGPDGLDSRQNGSRPGAYRETLDQGVKGLRIGLVREGFGRGNSEPGVDDKVRRAARRFEQLGAIVSEVSVPMHKIGPSIWGPIGYEGGYITMLAMNGVGVGHEGLYVPGLADAVSGWRDRSGEWPDTVAMMMLVGSHTLKQTGGRYYAKAMNLRRRLRAAYDAALSEVDLLLMPTSPIVASKLPAPDATPEQATRAAWEMLSNTSAFNITGHPSMSSPCGLSDGLPVGMMLTGKHWDEATIYRAAHAFEQAGDWRDI
jgi:amidase